MPDVSPAMEHRLLRRLPLPEFPAYRSRLDETIINVTSAFACYPWIARTPEKSNASLTPPHQKCSKTAAVAIGDSRFVLFQIRRIFSWNNGLNRNGSIKIAT